MYANFEFAVISKDGNIVSERGTYPIVNGGWISKMEVSDMFV